MSPEERDPASLWDMLTAAREVRQCIQGVGFEQYMRNRVLQLAVERGIEIIGEAANNVSKAFQKAHPEISWRRIIAQRHVLAHEYGEVDHQRIWAVVTVHIPELIAKIEPQIPPLPPKVKD